jgi:cytochrome c
MRSNTWLVAIWMQSYGCKKLLAVGPMTESKVLPRPYRKGMKTFNAIFAHTQLMHRLPSKASFQLSLPQSLIALAAALGAFFMSNANAQAASAAQPSAQRGMAIYAAKCSACHSVGENGVGPAHAGVYGRRAGKAKAYEYSEALAKSNIVWSKPKLQAWLTDPEKLIPGQRMGYRLTKPQERADVVAYLATLSAPK